MDLKISTNLLNNFPNIKVAILEVKNVLPKKNDTRLTNPKQELEKYIRSHYQDVKKLATINSYNQFFKKFGKTYPIQYQIQSILKGKELYSTFNVVECMYLAELRYHFLTAGHDLDKLENSLETRQTDGSEKYVKINGKEQQLKAEDIISVDAKGIVSSVLYGPDHRTRITEDTRNCLFFSYFPYGEEDTNVRLHFQEITNNLSIISDEIIIGDPQITTL
ncbi:MAG: phenylalanine--tRNA ligase beta subunit-related protein [Candidatus Kariarchaeaceae archaeon]|jgi:DNA/RNA-binding domain of Phe-tRNA-synthetase-like protein